MYIFFILILFILSCIGIWVSRVWTYGGTQISGCWRWTPSPSVHEWVACHQGRPSSVNSTRITCSVWVVERPWVSRSVNSSSVTDDGTAALSTTAPSLGRSHKPVIDFFFSPCVLFPLGLVLYLLSIFHSHSCNIMPWQLVQGLYFCDCQKSFASNNGKRYYYY